MKTKKLLIIATFLITCSPIAVADGENEGEKVEVVKTSNSEGATNHPIVRRAPARVVPVPEVYFMRGQLSLVFVQNEEEDNIPYYVYDEDGVLLKSGYIVFKADGKYSLSLPLQMSNTYTLSFTIGANTYEGLIGL